MATQGTCLLFVNTQSAVGGYYSDVKSLWWVYMKMDTYWHYLLLAWCNGCMLSFNIDNKEGGLYLPRSILAQSGYGSPKGDRHLYKLST